MAKTNYSYQKYQKDLAKRKKQEEKKKRKEERKIRKAQGNGELLPEETNLEETDVDKAKPEEPA